MWDLYWEAPFLGKLGRKIPYVEGHPKNWRGAGVADCRAHSISVESLEEVLRTGEGEGGSDVGRMLKAQMLPYRCKSTKR